MKANHEMKKLIWENFLLKFKPKSLQIKEAVWLDQGLGSKTAKIFIALIRSSQLIHYEDIFGI